MRGATKRFWIESFDFQWTLPFNLSTKRTSLHLPSASNWVFEAIKMQVDSKNHMLILVLKILDKPSSSYLTGRLALLNPLLFYFG